MERRTQTRLCYTYLCDRFPTCKKAIGSCCAIEMPDPSLVIQEEECYLLEDRPLYEEKPKTKRYGV